MLQAGHQVPHFTVTTLDGTEVSYGLIWQRQNLLLVLLGTSDSPESQAYLERLRAHMADLTAHDAACVITRDNVEGVPSPGAIVADRWGEIAVVDGADSPAGLPSPDALLEWLRYVQMQCPECQGEAR